MGILKKIKALFCLPYKRNRWNVVKEKTETDTDTYDSDTPLYLDSMDDEFTTMNSSIF